jgi:hypothetical protein
MYSVRDRLVYKACVGAGAFAISSGRYRVGFAAAKRPVRPFALLGPRRTLQHDDPRCRKTDSRSVVGYDPAGSHGGTNRRYCRVSKAPIHTPARTRPPRVPGRVTHTLRSRARCVSPYEDGVASFTGQGRRAARGVGGRGTRSIRGAPPRHRTLRVLPRTRGARD